MHSVFLRRSRCYRIAGWLKGPAANIRGPTKQTPITEDDEMYLKRKSDGHLIEVLSLNDLFAPTHPTVVGRLHYGEEIQDAEKFPKSDLSFPSGEDLPRCWVDVHYRDQAKR